MFKSKKPKKQKTVSEKKKDILAGYQKTVVRKTFTEVHTINKVMDSNSVNKFIKTED